MRISRFFWRLADQLVNAIKNHVENLRSTEAKAMVASTQPTAKPEKASISCKYCKRGHSISECRKLKRKKEEEKQKPKVSSDHFAMMAVVTT